MIDFDRKSLAYVERIKDVINHPNADRLDIVTINEWQCVTAKGTFEKGDFCIYFEIDSILPIEVESAIFGPDAKVRLKNAKVKTIKLRGAISQGLAVPIHTIFPNSKRTFMKGKDLTKELKIGKYVPTPKNTSVLYTGNQKKHASHNNPNFDRMRKPVHFKKVGAFDEPVMITEKIHGTSFIAGWIKRPTKTLKEKINAKLFGRYQFCYRSMNCQLQGVDTLWNNILIKFGFRNATKMNSTLYGRMCEKYNLKDKLFFGESVSAEIYGSGIQANYNYGCGCDEHKIAGFGLRIEGVEYSPIDAHRNLNLKLIPTVPVLYIGEFPEDITEYTEGASILDPRTKVREGCVINTISGNNGWHGSALIKNINPKYLLMSDNTEFN